MGQTLICRGLNSVLTQICVWIITSIKDKTLGMWRIPALSLPLFSAHIKLQFLSANHCSHDHNVTGSKKIFSMNTLKLRNAFYTTAYVKKVRKVKQTISGGIINIIYLSVCLIMLQL